MFRSPLAQSCHQSDSSLSSFFPRPSFPHLRRIRFEKERVDRLLSDASTLRQAGDIRAYVEAVQSQCYEENAFLAAGEFEDWVEWALALADRIDPVRSGSFLESIMDSDDKQEIENS